LLQPYLALIARIKTVAPIETGAFLLGGYFIREGEEQFDTVLVDKAALATFDPNSALSHIDTVDDLSDEEIDRLVQLPVLPETYAYEFSPWNEVLGYEVNPNNVSAVDSAKFAAAVLYRMTYLGFTEEAVDLERQKLQESLVEHEAILQLPPEEREKHLFSAEEVFAQLSFPDECTEEETEQEHREMYREVMENNLRIFRMLKKYG
jgi:hypothetical protein